MTPLARARLLVVATLGACAPLRAPVDPPPPLPIPDRAVARDPINVGDLPALRRDADQVLHALIAALPEAERAHMAPVVLLADPMPGEVNAYATCLGAAAAPVVAISDGLLLVEAELASARATDEVFGTDQVHAYIAWMADQAGKPVVLPPHTRPTHTDRRKVTRQHELFDEQLAYVLGHELAHHYLGHLDCTASGGISGELARTVAGVPLFDQISELAADVAAIKNVLAAGAQRTDYAWTEEGAIVLYDFLARWRSLSVASVVLAFESTHPLPTLRIPVITSAADQWRASGGALPVVF